MALHNQVSIVFTPQEVAQIFDALTIIENIVNPKSVNLTPKQRQQYGKIGDETENFVDKTIVYSDQKPEIVPFFIDKAELTIDIEARKVLDPILKRLSMLTEKLEDTHKLIGWDVYNSIMAIYGSVRMMSKQNVPGISVIYDDLKKQFPHHVTPPVEPPANPS